MEHIIKLTQEQNDILTPLIEAKNKADHTLQVAILLISGKRAGKYELSNGELKIEEVIEPVV